MTRDDDKNSEPRGEKISILLENTSPKALDVYDKEANILNFQIDEIKLKNIAIMAGYGAGKSSVIEKYLKKYRPKKESYARVTLAAFNDIDYDEPQIERNILQQLLYNGKKSQLPSSTIKRIEKTSWYKSIALSVSISVLFALLTLSYLEITENFSLGELKYLVLVITFIGIILFISWLIHNKKYQYIKYKDFEIKRENKEEDMINRFVDEVLYFFDSTKVNLVIFEDLDRLNNLKIFVKLHELNAIINNRSISNKTVTFLYAVKDDLFKSNDDRAKFFEFILPIIPVINPITLETHINDKLDRISEKNEKLKLPAQFIIDIANTTSNIVDMRILTNVFNDYVIMFDKIFCDTDVNIDHLSNEKLFSVCLYKNLFPYDYALLEKNSGLIPIVINMHELREKSIKKKEDEINETKKKIERVENEILENIDELKWILKGQYFSTYGSNVSQVMKYIDTIISFKDIDLKNVELEGRRYNLDIKLPSGESYKEREIHIKEKRTNKTAEYDRIILELQREKDNLEKRSLKEIIDDHGIAFCFDEERKIKNNYRERLQSRPNLLEEEIDEQLAFLRFLMYNQYIDEYYLEYVSNYKTKKFSKTDVQFIGFLNRGEQQLNWEINNLNEVISRLNVSTFNKQEILNSTILMNLEFIEKQHPKKYRPLSEFLMSDKEQVLDAIDKVLQISNDDLACRKLLQKIVPLNPKLCSKLLLRSISPERKKEIIVLMIKNKKNITAEMILPLNEYLNKCANYKNLFDDLDETEVIGFLNIVSPKFEILDSGYTTEHTIQKHIISECMYKLSIENVSMIVEKDDVKFYSENFEFLKKYNSIKKYIDNNLEQYVSNILLNDAITGKTEPSKNILPLIEENRIDIVQKRKIIEKYNVEVKILTKIDTTLWPLLIESGCVSATCENFIAAYNGVNLDTAKKLIKKNKLDGSLNACCDDTTMNKLINELLSAECTATELNAIANSIDKIISLNPSSFNDYKDENFSIFISKNKIIWTPIIHSNFKNKPKSLDQYLKINHDNLNEEKMKKFMNPPLMETELVDLINNVNIKVPLKIPLIHNAMSLSKEIFIHYNDDLYKLIESKNTYNVEKVEQLIKIQRK